MSWYVYLAYFAAGLFLANSIPHLIAGVSGAKFQSPFAKPPGVGESSSVVNTLWGFFNLAVGYCLIFGVGEFRFGINMDSVLVAAGFLLMALFCANHFSKVRQRS